MAADIGVKAAFGFPVEHEGKITAVLEFFSTESFEPDERVLWVMGVLGAQIGLVLERQRLLNERESSIALAEKQIRDQRVEEERNFPDILDTAPDAILIVDRDGVINSVNKAFESLLGYEAAKIEGKRVESLIPSRFKSHSELRNNYTKSPHPLNMSRTSRILYALHSDGREIPVQTNLSPIQTSEGTLISTVIVDLSEKVEADREQDVLLELGRIISYQQDIDSIFEQFADQLQEIIPFDRIVISTIDTEKKISIDSYVAGEQQEGGTTGVAHQLDNSGNSVVREWDGARVISKSVMEDFAEQFPGWKRRLEEGLVSALVAPLRWGNEYVGTINLRSRTPNLYDSSHVELLDRVALQISGAIWSARLTNDLESQASKQEALAEIGRVVNSELDLNSVYTTVADAIEQLLAYDRLAISLATAGGGSRRAFVRGIELENETPGGTGAFIERQGDGTLLFGSTEEFPVDDGFAKVGLQSWAESPIGSLASPIGYLSVRSLQKNAYTKQDIDFLKQVSAQIAPAIENAQLIENLEIQASQQEAIAEIGRTVNSNLNVDDVYNSVADALKSLIPYDRISIVLNTSDERSEGVFVRGIKMERTGVGATGMPGTEAPFQPDRRADGSVLIGLAEQHPNPVSFAQIGLPSWVEVPLGSQTSPIGYLSLRSSKESAFTEHDVEFLNKISVQITPAILNARLLAQTQNQSEEMTALAAVGREVNSFSEIQAVYDSVATHLADIVYFDRLTIQLYSEDGESAEMVHVVGAEIPGYEIGATVSRTGPYPMDGDNSVVARAGLAVAGAGFSTVLDIELGDPDKPIGAFRILKREGTYDRPEYEQAARFATQVLPAIVNARLNERLRKEAEERAKLAEIGRIVTSVSTLDEIYPLLVTELQEVIPFDRVSISTLDQDGNLDERYVAGTSVEDSGLDPVTKLSETVIAELYSKLEPTVLQGSELAEWSAGSPDQSVRIEFGLVSMLVAPLIWNGRIIGLITFRSMVEMAYSEYHANFMRQVVDQITGAIENAEVHEQLVELADQLEAAALLDTITGLANRAGVEDQLGEYLNMEAISPVSVLSAKFDRTKELEDRFGAAFVNNLLQAIGSRLATVSGGPKVVGRVSDDTFVACFTGQSFALAARSSAESMRAVLQAPFEIEGDLFAMDVAIGIALFPGHSLEAAELVRKSVLASSAAQDDASGVAVFKKELEETASDHVRLLTAVREGRNRGEMELHYQPKVDLTTAKIASAEALIRWNSPERGMVSPGIFIPIMEDSGYMWEFTTWTLSEGMKQIHKVSQMADESEWDAVPVAINVSAADFQDSRLPEVIAGSLELWNVDPKMVEIEVTETGMMNAPDQAIEVCKKLKSLGVSVAIDDFGVGQSPLAYLGNLDIDVIKIDMAFVKNIHLNSQAQTIVKSIIDLGTKLGKKLVAEGVEIQEEADVLRELGCHYGQGYLWARPMPEDEFLNVLEHGLGDSR